MPSKISFYEVLDSTCDGLKIKLHIKIHATWKITFLCKCSFSFVSLSYTSKQNTTKITSWQMRVLLVLNEFNFVYASRAEWIIALKKFFDVRCSFSFGKVLCWVPKRFSRSSVILIEWDCKCVLILSFYILMSCENWRSCTADSTVWISLTIFGGLLFSNRNEEIPFGVSGKRVRRTLKVNTILDRGLFRTVKTFPLLAFVM